VVVESFVVNKIAETTLFKTSRSKRRYNSNTTRQ